MTPHPPVPTGYVDVWLEPGHVFVKRFPLRRYCLPGVCSTPLYSKESVHSHENLLASCAAEYQGEDSVDT